MKFFKSLLPNRHCEPRPKVGAKQSHRVSSEIASSVASLLPRPVRNFISNGARNDKFFEFGNRLFKKTIRYILAIAIIVLVFNIPVTTRQGIGGVVYEIKIPFYAKLCGFLYRDYQYKALSRRIVNGVEGNEKKVMAIYNWTIANVKRRPEGFTIVDDHIWDIIVRGYGTDDQAADVFTTLVSYAGYEAFWDKLYTENSRKALIISFVKINDKWHIFDVYNKKYLIDEGMQKMPTRYGPTYEEYLNSMDKTHFEIGIKRPDKQKLIPRLIFEFKRAFLKTDIEKGM